MRTNSLKNWKRKKKWQKVVFQPHWNRKAIFYNFDIKMSKFLHLVLLTIFLFLYFRSRNIGRRLWDSRMIRITLSYIRGRWMPDIGKWFFFFFFFLSVGCKSSLVGLVMCDINEANNNITSSEMSDENLNLSNI